MTTITASSTIGISLTSPAFINPVLINPAVTISSTTGDAIAASSGGWTLQNNGQVSGRGVFANGIDLSAGGAVTNFATGLVTGSSDGVRVFGAAGTVVNYGSIAGLATGPVYSGFGVDLEHGGAVTNHSGGTISGYASGINVYSAAGTVINAGVIAGHNYNGVILQSGGAVTNQAGGTISGGAYGVLIKGAAGIAVNAGMISGGIGLYAGGAVTNQAGGTIVGSTVKVGVYVAGGAGTVINAGSIGGGISFAYGFTNLLLADPGAVFAGTVNGGSAAGSELELAAGGSGSLSGIGTQFINFGSIVFDAGGTWFIGGDTAGLSGTISGFAVGDTIELSGVTATGSSYSGGILTIQEAGGAATLHLPGAFTTSSFHLVSVAGGTDISLTAPCFRTGTRILTNRGELPVETIKVGDQVSTILHDRLATVIWVGCRRVDCARHPDPRQVWPVCIRAGAFGPSCPHNDLYVSPDHAIFVNDVLIPARHLLNGTSISQRPCDEVTYHHLELAEHDVLLAEGLTVESYLETKATSNYVDRPMPVRLHADFSSRTWEAHGCAPLVVNGPQVDAVRQLLRSYDSAGSEMEIAAGALPHRRAH